MYKVSVAEAARCLGVSQDAVYKRIKRETIPWEKGAGDKTYVWIEEQDASTDSPSSSTDRRYDSSTDQSTDQSTDPLLDELRDRIRFLEAELEDRKDEARRKDTVIMSLTQRIPELEAAPERRESPQPSSEEPYSTHAPPTPERPDTSVSGHQERKQSWWREFLGMK